MQPAEILEAGIIDDSTQIYLIGIVKPGTLTITPGTQDHTFTITDFIHEITVHFSGILPASLREGETARIEGEFIDEYNPTTFIGSTIMAAHDSEATKNVYQPRSRNILVNNKSVL
jgi:cytochrome c-type biogenesis protein CcmE|mmetsp:Transcript_33587/g.6097  ORF Transcript_33587/g.6097 Transcript_33587/m.6097 type:complete len:116 (+) Transcript_33587:219-566(+)